MIQQRPNESDEDYEKRKRRVKLTMMGGLANGGGSIIAAAAIYYQDNGGNFLYIPDGSDNLVLDNKGSLGPTYDGLLYSGRGIELGATNDVDIPIHHTLGAELTTNIDTALTAGTGTFIYTKNSNSAFDLAITVVGTDVNNPRQDNSMVITNGETYKIYMDVSITSGTPLIRKIDGVIINRTLTSGTNIIEFTATADKSALFIVWDELSLYDISVTNYSVKQITNPNSYLTYYDFTDGLVTLGNSVDGGSSDNLEKIINGDFGNGVTSWVANGTGGVTFQEVNRQLEVSRSGTTGGAPYQIVAGISTSKTYLVSIDRKDSNCTVAVGSGAGNTDYALYSAGNPSGVYTVVVAPTTTQIAITLWCADGTTVYFDDASIKEILPISTKYTINSKTVNNVLTHTTNWSALDWSKINNNPNLVGKLAVETLGATKTIAELDMELDQGASADSYYMCSEKEGAYLVDSRVAYGAEQLTNGTFNTDIAGWIIYGTGSVAWSADNGGSILLTVAAALDGIRQNGTLLAGNNFVSFKVKSSALRTLQYYNGSTWINFPEQPSSTGVYQTLSGIINATTTTNFIIRILDGVAADTFYFDDITSQAVSAQSVANYAETVRTNADLQQKGIQQTAFVTDGAGVPTEYSSNLLQFTGDGRYVDTKWIPSGTEPFTIEYVWELENSAIDARIGTFNVGFRNTLGVVYYQAGASSINGGSVSSGLYHLVASFDGVNVTFYVNNVSKGSVAGNTSAIKTFTLGARNATALDFPSYNPSGTFKVYKNKALTATEVATAYAKAKTIYPTLP